MDAFAFIRKHYPADGPLRRLLVEHSLCVARRALRIAGRHPELRLDTHFLFHAAMLHDIGIFLCDAPGIHCHGSAPYLLHGRLGAELLRREGLEAYARVCERHTGTGLTAAQIVQQGLPLPPQDFCPETEEERVICYADKFYSKSHPERTKRVDEAARSLAKFGAAGVEKFMEWARRYE
ncbi:MAG: HDIG domain-containing protein [Bacteroidaceae bacterium]|nr:HDIG domain-containing protein [Bacteroidaceae bacterium]